MRTNFQLCGMIHNLNTRVDLQLHHHCIWLVVATFVASVEEAGSDFPQSESHLATRLRTLVWDLSACSVSTTSVTLCCAADKVMVVDCRTVPSCSVIEKIL